MTIAGFMLALLIIFVVLATRDEKPMHGIVIVMWLMIFVTVPAAIGLLDWKQYQHGISMEKRHVITTGKIIRLYSEDTSVGDQASTVVYRLLFMMDGQDDFLVRQTVGHAAYQKLKTGDSITVMVSPTDRRICRAVIE
jgi:hypothetical protein